VRAVEQAQQVARTGGGAGGVGVHAVGGRILQAASSGRLCCGRLQRPARLLHLVGPHRRLRAEPLTIRLGVLESQHGTPRRAVYHRWLLADGAKTVSGSLGMLQPETSRLIRRVLG
jgi:hypothetical protein